MALNFEGHFFFYLSLFSVYLSVKPEVMRNYCFLFLLIIYFGSTDSLFPQSSLKAIQVKVYSNQKPLKNAVVSDGVHVFQTNTKGKVQFKTQQPFVFLSYPSQHDFEVLPNGSVDFFRSINPDDQHQQKFVFQLKRNPNDENSHHFLAIADPQLQTTEEADLFQKESVQDLVKTVNEIGNFNVFGVTVGDIVFDRFDLFDNYNQSIKSVGIPFFQVMGNHDLDLSAPSHANSLYPFTNQYGPTYYSFNKGNVHYVVLSSVFFLGNKQYYGYLDDQQLKWLKEDLDLVNKQKPLVIFLHIPSASQAAQLNPGRDSNKESVINKEALFQLIHDFKDVHLISGHVHWNENIQIADHILEHNLGAISGAWWAADIAYDGSPKGYGVFQVNNEEVSWYFKAIAQPKDFQFRTYITQNVETQTREFILNIWNWDPQWKIKWFENDILKGEATMVPGFDPLALSTFEPGLKREKHPWITPQKTKHLFSFTANTLHLPIRIQITDRFGNVFEEIHHENESY
jgi:hypothetical protein